jgi:NDP-4-keto-2,6-dideoxyhexose 3-C-methyltransferase
MRITHCRVCQHKDLVKIGSLGAIAISDFTKKPEDNPKYPLELVYCENCTLLQLAHNMDRDILYKNYWYESHINPVIVNNLKDIAGYVKGDIHIDIAGNDGTLLAFSKAKRKISVDPSNILPHDCQWIQDYWENVTLSIKADTITAIACLYDLPDPNAFIKNVTSHLAPDGTFIAQLMTLTPFIEQNDVGNICHEHLLYFSYKSLVRLYEQNGLEIYKVEENGINGGSYQIFARHYKTGSIMFSEKEYDTAALQAFFKRIEENKQKLVDFAKDHKIVGFGASTKMGTIVQYYGYTPEVIVDANPNKTGTYTVGGAKVVETIPEGTEYLWVFPYGFLDFFRKKEKAYTGKWIVTMPDFKIYG